MFTVLRNMRLLSLELLCLRGWLVSGFNPTLELRSKFLPVVLDSISKVDPGTDDKITFNTSLRRPLRIQSMTVSASHLNTLFLFNLVWLNFATDLIGSLESIIVYI